MSDRERNIRTVVTVAALLAAATAALALLVFPPDFSTSWLVALGTLYALGALSGLLALNITEGGTTTSMNFIPHLAAIVLVGPAGAVALTALSQLTFQVGFERKGALKATYNVAQVVLSVGLAALVYRLLGGASSLEEFSLTAVAVPFLAAAITYFVLNRTAVSYVISIAEDHSIEDLWQRISGRLVLFDVAMSPIALLAAYLYVRWGPVALLAVAIPIIGLRYSYGVNIELQQLNRDLLQVLIKTLEAQDRYTSGHSIRVAERARLIAGELDLAPKRIHVIETAALLHDIGKIGSVYSEILQQDGPLTPEQRGVIKQHPERGVEIIQSVQSIDPRVLDFVRHHHERFDGAGYPGGLAGEEIPLGARIIMVADTIDAMSTERPYRDAIPLPEIKEELLRHRGKQFDPDVVHAALAAGLLERHVTVAEGLYQSPEAAPQVS